MAEIPEKSATRHRWLPVPDHDTDVSSRPGSPKPPISENQNVLFVHSLRRSFGQFLLFHFPAVAVTIGLLIIHVLRLSFDLGNDVLASLLFASKVHEGLIIASLFQMLYYHLRKGLLGPEGVPFGYLTSAFQLSSPFYLASSSFLAPLVRYQPVTLSSLVLTFLLIFTFLLAALAGASSGVVTLPRLGWWEINLDRVNASAFLGYDQKFSHTIVSPVEQLYPATIGVQSLSGTNCTRADNLTFYDTIYCPFGNYRNVLDTSWDWMSILAKGGEGGGGDVSRNLTGASGRALTWWERKPSLQAVFAATTPLDAIVSTISAAAGNITTGWGAAYQFPSRISARLSDKHGQPLPVKQPRVSIQCADRKDPSPDDPPGFDTFRLRPALYPDMEFRVNSSRLYEAIHGRSSGGKKLDFIDLTDSLLPVRPSAAYWLRCGHGRLSEVCLCLVDARWIDSDAWIMPQAGNIPQYSLSLGNATVNATLDPDQIIKMDVAWLRMLNTTVLLGKYDDFRLANGTREYIYNRLLDLALEDVLGGPLYQQQAVAQLMTVFLADVLSMVSTGKPLRATSRALTGPWQVKDFSTGVSNGVSVNLEDLPSYARISPGYYHNVYEYNLEGTTIRLAWAVLLLHMLLVAVHFVVTCAQGSWQSDAWSQLGDLVALAMQANPDGIAQRDGDGREEPGHLEVDCVCARNR